VINPLAVATRGRLSTSVKRTLTLATLGWLVVTTDPVPEKPKGGGGNRYTTPKQQIDKNITFVNIKRDDDEVLNLIKIFLECQR
jgi:hypothetical protein